MAITQCAWEWKQWAWRDEITALHFSKATPVDTKTIHQQQGGWGQRGLEDFLVSEPRAVRQVIPSNERRKKKKRMRRGGREDVMAAVKALTASVEAFDVLKPRSVTGTPSRTFYSCLCTETQRIERCLCRLSAVFLVWRFGQCLAETQGEGGSAWLKRV